MTLYRVKLTYSTTRRIETHEFVIDAASQAAAETAADALVSARAPHLTTWSMAKQAGLTAITAL